MSFTLSGTTITQANEAPKTITSVTNPTNGIRVACAAHGFVTGNVVLITGTPSYNGRWIVSGVLNSETFDITNQSFDGAGVNPLVFVGTATGTVARGDANLSGLGSIAGVTTWQITGGAKPITWYVLSSSMRLVVTGLMRIPQGNVLVIQGDFGFNGRLHQSGGDIWIDKRMSRFGGVSYQPEDAIIFRGGTGTGGRSWENPPQAFIHLESGNFIQ